MDVTITEEWMRRLQEIAQTSSDPDRQVGALILGSKGEVLAEESNQLPLGCVSEPSRLVRPEKYFWIEHAERNAIYAAGRRGHPVTGATLLTTHAPCMDCARAIVASGIQRVIAVRGAGVRWQAHTQRSVELFRECGVDFTILHPDGAPSGWARLTQRVRRFSARCRMGLQAVSVAILALAATGLIYEQGYAPASSADIQTAYARVASVQGHDGLRQCLLYSVLQDTDNDGPVLRRQDVSECVRAVIDNYDQAQKLRAATALVDQSAGQGRP